MSIKNRYVGLAGLVFLAGYLVFASWFPFKAGYDQLPLPDIYRFTPTGLAAAAYALWLLALFGLLWWLYRLVRSGQLAPTWFWLLAGAALFCLPLVFSFPINATDLYRYYLSGRVTAHYGASPFSTPPGVFEAAPYFDEFMALGGEWRTVTTPYGPLWELLAAAVAGLCGDNLHLALVVFKSLGARLPSGGRCAHLAAAAPGRSGRAAGTHPAVAVESGALAHPGGRRPQRRLDDRLAPAGRLALAARSAAPA